MEKETQRDRTMRADTKLAIMFLCFFGTVSSYLWWTDLFLCRLIDVYTPNISTGGSGVASVVVIVIVVVVVRRLPFGAVSSFLIAPLDTPLSSGFSPVCSFGIASDISISISKAYISPKLISLQSLYLSKAYISPKLISLQSLYLSKAYISPKLISLQSLYLSKAHISPKLISLLYCLQYLKLYNKR